MSPIAGDMSERSEPTSPTSCRICKEGRLRPFDHRGFRWGRCPDCGAILKVLTPEEYRALDTTYDPGDYYEGLDRDQVREQLGVGEREAFLSRYASEIDAERPAFLDIGCGLGSYLLAAQQLGFEVLGVEPSETHSKLARELFDLPVRTSFFDSSEILPRTFDLVMLSHVIEHILDPEAFLNDAMRVVSPKGSMVVVTPNAGSSLSRLLGRQWNMLNPADHVSLLTARSFRSMKLNDVARVEFAQSEYPWEFLAAVASAFKAGIEATSRGESTPSEFRPTMSMRRGKGAEAAKSALVLLSLPFHALNRLCRLQSCLIVKLVRA